MRILLLSLADLTSPTADAMWTLNTARELGRLGHEVTVLAPRQAGSSTSAPVTGFTIRWHFNVRRLRLPNVLNSAVQCLLLGRLRRQTAATLVYVRAALLTALIGAWSRLPGRPRVVSEHHGWAEAERRLSGRFAFLAPLERCMQVLDARLASRVRTVVPGIRERLLARGIAPERVFVVDNACDTERIVPHPRAPALARRGLDEAGYYLGFAGSLAPWQGLDTVIEAMPAVLAALPRACLLVIGDGPERAALQAHAEALSLGGAVRFLGRIDHADMADALACFDLALLPTAVDGYAKIGRSPLKLREYAAAGRRVAAARIPAVEDLAGEPWLRLFEPGDPAGLAAVVVECAAVPAPADVAERARAYAESNFAWPAIMRQVAAGFAIDAPGA